MENAQPPHQKSNGPPLRCKNLQQACSNAVPTTGQQDVFELLVPRLLTSCQRLVDNLLQGCRVGLQKDASEQHAQEENSNQNFAMERKKPLALPS